MTTLDRNSFLAGKLREFYQSHPISTEILEAANALDALSSLPAQAVGVKPVPLEPTQEMINAGLKRNTQNPHPWLPAVYRAMLAVAPSQPAAVAVTDEMIGRAIDAWHADKQRTFASTPKSSMRAALEAALVHRDQVKL